MGCLCSMYMYHGIGAIGIPVQLGSRSMLLLCQNSRG